MHTDAAERKVKDPIDYLIEAEKKARKLAIPLALSGSTELADEANALYRKIIATLDSQPIEAWETTKQNQYTEELRGMISQGGIKGE